MVPLFNPSARLADVVARLALQCDRVILVDDGSDDESWDSAARLACDRVSVIGPRSNSGIASALNVGVRLAMAGSGVDFILTCDQDSLISELYVAAAMHRLSSAEDPESYALICASAYNGVPVPSRLWHRREPLEPMQSGMLIRASTFMRIGYFSDHLFIDCVDTDFYLRCRSAGLKALLAPPCPLAHHLGASRWNAEMADRHSRHPSWRTYYVARNRLKMMQIYGVADPEWSLRISVIQLVGMAALLVSSPDRYAQWAAMRLGYRAFRAGVNGPLSARGRRMLLSLEAAHASPAKGSGRG
ncbi:glycosyltransferase [Terrabacter lapilli]|uniref:glycosyltransferase n=1 Tax=Terrabacter lapilli TaxID=436231 RepID=UPI003CD0B0CA